MVDHTLKQGLRAHEWTHVFKDKSYDPANHISQGQTDEGSDNEDVARARVEGGVQDDGSGGEELPAEQEYTRVMRKLLTLRHPRKKRTAKTKFKLVGVVARKKTGAVWGSTKWSREELAKKVSATTHTIITVTLLARSD